MKDKTRIGLNLASMLPWSAIPGIGLPIAAWMTKKAGYGFWQALPVRSVTIESLKATGIQVRFAEPAWNATTFRAHFRGEFGAGGTHTKPQDPLFFPNPEECARRFNQFFWYTDAKLIYHHLKVPDWPGSPLEMRWLEKSLVEVHPGLKRSATELVAAVKAGMVPQKPYVPDLRHLRRSDEDGFDLGPWRETLEALLPLTALIHVQASGEKEWEGFLEGKAVELAEMLCFLVEQGYEGPFVVEFDPRAGGPSGLLPWKLADNLREVRERTERILALR